jgi:hypothetical protein
MTTALVPIHQAPRPLPRRRVTVWLLDQPQEGTVSHVFRNGRLVIDLDIGAQLHARPEDLLGCKGRKLAPQHCGG